MHPDWQQKRLTPEEAVGMVKSGMRVGMGWAPGDPPTLQRALLARRDDLEDVRLGPLNGNPELILDFCSPASDGHFAVWIVYGFPYHRAGLGAGRIELAPPMLGLYERFLTTAHDDPHTSDIYMVRLSPPDANGYCSFGAAIWQAKYAMARAKVVIAEIDDSLIRTYGDNFVHVRQIDHWVRTDNAPGEAGLHMATGHDSEICDVIGAHASTLVGDGDTLQVGAGTASAAIYDHLAGKSDLGLHTEVAEDAAIRLAEAGVITNRYKTIDTGKTVAAWFRGEPDMMRVVEMNPRYELREVGYVDSPRVCSDIDNFVAINSALAVDLTGQVSSESFGHVMYGGPGGQPELMLGAMLSKGGRNMICIPSTAKQETISRIVPTFDAGTVVTTPRHFVDYVVTEFGVASLFGKSLQQRVAALAEVAHPMYRDQLLDEGRRLHGVLPVNA
jgi:4-hydroxybutyrate CoA-transferase